MNDVILQCPSAITHISCEFFFVRYITVCYRWLYRRGVLELVVDYATILSFIQERLHSIVYIEMDPSKSENCIIVSREYPKAPCF